MCHVVVGAHLKALVISRRDTNSTLRHVIFLDLNADSHGVKTHQKASFKTKNG